MRSFTAPHNSLPSSVRMRICLPTCFIMTPLNVNPNRLKCTVSSGCGCRKECNGAALVGEEKAEAVGFVGEGWLEQELNGAKLVCEGGAEAVELAGGFKGAALVGKREVEAME
mmetsp:Transcript_39059/g.66489  ORF Transcript_39059/g.66489 Transcript_39059/m.66489 type:complete len:113 (+) Transcript_39059:221-559(+)